MKSLLIFLISYLYLSQSLMASTESLYDFSWLSDKEKVFVLQNRIYTKKNELYVGGSFGAQINGAFINSNHYDLRAGFYFSENYGLELSFGGFEGKTNSTHDAVNEQASAVAFYRKIESIQSAYFMFSPFYSKINTFNKIMYYDLIFGLGVSSINTLDNRNEFEPSSPDSSVLTKENLTAISWLISFRFFINQSWSVDTRFKGHHANVKMYSEDVSNNDTSSTRMIHYYLFDIGLNYAF